MAARMRRASKVMFQMHRGVWVATWYEDGGSRRTRRLPGATNKDEAKAMFEQRTKHQEPSNPADRPADRSTKVATLQDIREVFQRQVLRTLKLKTQLLYDQVFDDLAGAKIVTAADFRAEKLRALTDVLLDRGIASATQHKILRAVRRFMRWACDAGYLTTVPKLVMPKVVKRSRGRPLTDAEFERMLAATDGVYRSHPDRAVGCKRFLWGLWLSGLRLSEGVSLSWDDPNGFHIDATNFERPVFVLPAEMDKTGQDRIFPMVPEFWQFLSQTPDANRRGFVFNVRPTIGAGRRMSADDLSDLVSQIGRKAGVRVSSKKFASIHDLRRSFGLRWAQRVNQMQLMALMRHSDPATTATYYIGANAAAMLESVWSASKVGESHDSKTQASPPTSNAHTEPCAKPMPCVAPPLLVEPPIDPDDEVSEVAQDEPSEVREPRQRRPRTKEPETEPVAVTAKVAMKMLSISRVTLRQMERQGTIRASYPLGPTGHPRYLVDDILKVISATGPASQMIEFWLPKKAADLLGVTSRTVTRMIDAGTLRGRVTPGGHRKVRADDVRRLLAKRQAHKPMMVE